MAATGNNFRWVGLALAALIGAGCTPFGEQLTGEHGTDVETTSSSASDDRPLSPTPPHSDTVPPTPTEPSTTDVPAPPVAGSVVAAGGEFADVFGPPTGRLDEATAPPAETPPGTMPPSTDPVEPPPTETPPATVPPTTVPPATPPPTTVPPTTTPPTTAAPPETAPPATDAELSPTLAATRTMAFAGDVLEFVNQWNQANTILTEAPEVDVGPLQLDASVMYSGSGLTDDGLSYSISDPIDGGFLAAATSADGRVTATLLHGSTASSDLFDGLMTLIALTDAEPSAVIDSSIRATESAEPFDEVFATGGDGHWRVRLEDDVFTVARVATSDASVARLTSDLLLLDAVLLLPTPGE